ncbi:MAG: hypothetical protein WCI18_12485 [Pseudomonadota bacterium]
MSTSQLKHLQIHKKKKIFLLFVMTFSLNGCFADSVYKFQSQPSDASIYYLNGSEKNLVGQTPIDYTKTSLPSDAPFTVLFEKQGYESKEISITPTHNSQTIISANLKVSKDNLGDATSKRMREILKKVFQIQELTAQTKYVDALALINKVSEQEPNIAELFILKGSIYFLLNDQTQAKQAWLEALKIDSSLDSLRTRIKSIEAKEKTAKDKGTAP